MTVLSLTALETAAAQADFTRTIGRAFDRLVERLAPEPGPAREAVRYELGWALLRHGARVVDRLATLTPPASDGSTPPGFWEDLSRELAADQRRAGVMPGDFDDEDTLPGFAHGTPTTPPPAIVVAPAGALERVRCEWGVEAVSQKGPPPAPTGPWCERCRRTILPGAPRAIMDGAEVCGDCAAAEMAR